jgi:ABC-type cobalt transport system substrate-binding protein
MKSILASIVFLLITHLGFCQGQTIKFLENSTSPQASLDEVSWIQGYWKGEAFGGITEEFWSPPLGDSMMFSFKLVVDNKVVFYELGGIRQKDKTLLLQLKHFGNDFKGWEEKDETVDFKLVKIENNKVYFDQFTFEKISENEMNLYVVISENGHEEEVKFNYLKE